MDAVFIGLGLAAFGLVALVVVVADIATRPGPHGRLPDTDDDAPAGPAKESR